MMNTRVATRVTTLSHVVFGVSDLDAAVEFWTTAAALEAVTVRDKTATLATGDGRVALVLTTSGQTGLQRLAYEVADLEALEVFQKRLEAAGVLVERGTDEWVGKESLFFHDPDGFSYSLVVRGKERDLEAGRGGPVLKVLHPLLVVSDLKRTEKFLTDVLGFLPSDYVGDVTVFMYCEDAYHHSMAITRNGEPGHVDHICFHLENIDTLMRARNRLRRYGKVTCTDVYRHGGSHSMAFYFVDPHSGVQIEYCAQHRRVTDGNHQPRVLEPSETTFDLWQDIDVDIRR